MSVVVAAISCTMTWWLTSGLPRQFMVMKANRRCSIRFHLLVPGGSGQTAIFRPVSLASRAVRASTLQRGAVAAAAVGGDRSGGCVGITRLAEFVHQRRMLSTAKAPVSALTPTLTQPWLAAMS